jgi:hypothetical protein
VAPPTLPPGLPFVDDFTRIDNVSLGSGWITHEGPITTDGSFAVAGGTSSWARPVLNLGGTNDYAVTVNGSKPSVSPHLGVVARSVDPASVEKHAYSARIIDSGVVLVRHVNFVWTTLQSFQFTVTPGATYNLKLVATGTNPVHLEVWVNGKRRISYNDSSADRHTTGMPGLSSSGGASVTWDSFRVDAQ